jgi:hypothetical protein
MDILWNRLQTQINNGSVTQTEDTTEPYKQKGTIRTSASVYPLLPRHYRPIAAKSTQSFHRIRSFQLTEDEPKYALPLEKYPSMLLSDRLSQGHILSNEFQVVATKLRIFQELLIVRVP